MDNTAYVNSGGRGIVLYIKQSFHSAEIDKSTELNDSVWCKVRLQNNDTLTVGVVYRSPNATEIQNSQLMSTITEIERSRKQTQSLIDCGGF